MNNRSSKIIGLFWVTIISITLTAFSVKDIMKSDGGPPYNTNAPGEKTCSGTEPGNGCHSGGIPDNSGPAIKKAITFSGGTSYIPGQTYTVTVTISHPSRNRFGFQIVSLRNSNSANAGTAIITDVSRTRSQIPTFGSFQTRNYVMHILNGSNGIANSCSWSYNWTAPATSEGDITFYACMLAANNNNLNDAGDETYFSQLTIKPTSVGISSQELNFNEISLYPNPATNVISINYTLNETSSFKVELIDIRGKLIQVLYHDKKAIGTIAEKVSLTPGIIPGIYLIKFTTDKMESTKRIIIQ
ncbi:MAG: T9SS type A sorting domain-containing protein [Bacteroidetes bacterium]|nr:T9SS type A sorting domain-containing protein [Bacteroidota bacterium]